MSSLANPTSPIRPSPSRAGNDGSGGGSIKQNDSSSGRRSPAEGTAANFPSGPAARRQLRQLLARSTDPETTIQSYQRRHSLHAMFAKAFGTTPSHDLPSSTHRAPTRAASNAKSVETQSGARPEPFDPAPVFDFLTHLGVTHQVAHRRVVTNLRSTLEDEIARVPLSSDLGRDALLRLLRGSWQFRDVPELRPVLVALLKRLGDRTPPQVLRLLAAKEKGTNDLKHAELLSQFGLPLRRLVWEADWEGRRDNLSDGGTAPTAGGGDADSGGATGTLRGSSLLADLIRPAVENYCNDAALVKSADLPFVAIPSERRVATKARRSAHAAATATATGQHGQLPHAAPVSLASIGAAATASSMGTSSRPTTTGAAATQAAATKGGGKGCPSSGYALAKISEVVGDRQKLLAAVLEMLIAEHGNLASSSSSSGGASSSSSTHVEGATTVLGGASHLPCSLVSDILLSYGHLPRPYEHVGILAKVIDNSVRIGVLSDDALAQVQGCLRIVFQSSTQQGKEADKRDDDGVGEGGGRSGNVADAMSAASMSSATAKKKAPRDDRDFEMKLLKKVLGAAIHAMKENDPQHLFLNPVTDAIAPNYSRVIKKPMCIRVIEDKVLNSQYSSLKQYESDVQLMFQNCITYNVGEAGQWFRGEAARQRKVWKDSIVAQARSKLKAEMMKRKKALDRADAEERKEDRKRKRGDAGGGQPFGKGMSVTPMGATMEDKDAVSRLTSNDIDPLPPSRAKKRKKDVDVPSMPCLAAMILADPFVVRLLLDKMLRALRVDVLKGKNLPAGHRTIPSVLQLLQLSQYSRELCAVRGKRFVVPDAGFMDAMAEGEEVMDEVTIPFASLRKYTPLLTKLLLEVELDRRMSVGGDLHDAAVHVLPSRPKIRPEEWVGTSSLSVLRALVEGSLVHLLQPGNSNEVALQAQYPRFAAALGSLSDGMMLWERPFFLSLVHALLRHKSKLAHSTRDMVAESWLRWLKEGKTLQRTQNSCITTSPAHECFIYLLNEWTTFGNIVLPRDRLLSLAEEAVKATESSEDEAFCTYWVKSDDSFCNVKGQYTRMLSSIPDSRANSWKEKVGIGDAKLSAATKEIASPDTRTVDAVKKMTLLDPSDD